MRLLPTKPLILKPLKASLPVLAAAVAFSMLSDAVRVSVAVEGEDQGLIFGQAGVVVVVGVDGISLAGIVAPLRWKAPGIKI